jgi:hypothetical protein
VVAVAVTGGGGGGGGGDAVRVDDGAPASARTESLCAVSASGSVFTVTVGAATALAPVLGAGSSVLGGSVTARHNAASDSGGSGSI